jgi:hypothetical protein
LAPPQPSAGSFGGGYGAQPAALAGRPFQKSLGGAVTTLVFAAIGAITPFLPYVSDGYDSYSGWDSREWFSEFEEFSASPLLVFLGSLAALVLAIVIIANQNKSTPTNKTGVGVGILISGIVAMGSAGLAYSSWDSILVDLGLVAEQGVGLWLGALCGLAVTILGIVTLAVPKVTQGNQ